MKHFSLLLALVLVVSCSKPTQDSTSADSTVSVTDATTPTAPEPEPIKLTAEEMEKVNWAIFRYIHDDLIYDDSLVTAYTEEFVANGADITYKLLRHNGDNAGWHAIEQEEAETGDATDEADKQSEDSNLSEEQQQAYNERYGSREQEETYENEIDTLTINTYYVAYVEAGQPESPTKTVRIKLRGPVRFENYYAIEPYGELKKDPFDREINFVVVNLGSPVVIDRTELYLRAKITNLTDKDLAGLNKDDLGYVRNEIFARHGHTFKTDKMIRYFQNTRWYHSIVDDAAGLLNKFEKRNVEFIKKKEG